jgi:hypothetical protein
MKTIKTAILVFWMLILCLKVFSICIGQAESYPDRLACPVTPNIFPEQIRSIHLIRFVFSGQEVAHRISISLQSAEGKNIEVQFRWFGAWSEFTRPPFRDYGVHFGTFIVKADGSPNCFFLGPNANMPGNISVNEFDLRIPDGVQIKQIVFSTLPSEIVSTECPMPSIEKKIGKAFEHYISNPKDQTNIRNLIQLLSETIPTYDCRRNYDYTPIPAWWMAKEENLDKWFSFVLEQVKNDNYSALKLFIQFYATSDGYLIESLSHRLLEVFFNQPALVLRSWTDIREYGEKISEAIRFQNPEDTIRMVGVYRDIGIKNPALRSACNELVELLGGRVN